VVWWWYVHTCVYVCVRVRPSVRPSVNSCVMLEVALVVTGGDGWWWWWWWWRMYMCRSVCVCVRACVWWCMVVVVMGEHS
jgi:hypothetical protein